MADKYHDLYVLLENQTFPLKYPFKFIIKEDQVKLVKIKRVFDETAEFDIKKSRNGNYTSITIRQMMLTADAIIEKYKQLEGIQGLISL